VYFALYPIVPSSLFMPRRAGGGISRQIQTEAVPIWLIFTWARFGRRGVVSSSVSGNLARRGWLVSATAITLPDRSLRRS
jgi:hypothetical protein